VIDGVSNTIIDYVPVGAEPMALGFDSVNNKLYCATYADSSVSVIDGVTNAVIRTLSVGAAPASIACAPPQNRIFVANTGSTSISVLRDSGGGITERPTPQAAGPNPEATIVRGVLMMPVSLFSLHSSLFDLTGRRIMSLRPGANSIRHLAPGLYFLSERRADGTSRGGLCKVVIVR
jgi:YVTN family beta-propeller protein